MAISFVGSGIQENFDANEYYTFKLHRYTSLTDDDIDKPHLKKHKDIIIDMIPCQNQNDNKNEHEHDEGGAWDVSATKFCPNYNDEIFGGSYYLKKYSWLRLAVHRCDPNDQITVGGQKIKKKCKSIPE